MAAATPLWRAHVRHDPTERRPVRLLATPAYEVWVIGWTKGQAVPLHDHGEAAGAVAVVEGRLTERTVEDGRLRETRLDAGTVHRLPPDRVHEVANDDEVPATSIHVYSPPLSTMRSYEPTSPWPVGVEHVAHEPAVFAVDAVTLLAHPSSRG
jgi:predicted metal-dependent enzyme (double-stranded beta helix superfamily)